MDHMVQIIVVHSKSIFYLLQDGWVLFQLHFACYLLPSSFPPLFLDLLPPCFVGLGTSSFRARHPRFRVAPTVMTKRPLKGCMVHILSWVVRGYGVRPNFVGSFGL